MAASVDPWIADELVALPKVGSNVPQADLKAAICAGTTDVIGGRCVRKLGSRNTMSSDLLRTLKAMRTDPARVVDLYRQLYAGSFLVLVQRGTEADLGTALFLIYPSTDGIRELPIFTSRDYLLENLPSDAVLVGVMGDALWPRLLELVKAEECQVAVDPGQSHGIRLNGNMILGMIRAYGPR
jgi:hypothetical protein